MVWPEDGSMGAVVSDTDREEHDDVSVLRLCCSEYLLYLRRRRLVTHQYTCTRHITRAAYTSI